MTGVSMANELEVQDRLIINHKQNSTRVAVFLINGICLHGVIADHDRYTILLHEGGSQLVFKHAIATIIPEKYLVEAKKSRVKR